MSSLVIALISVLVILAAMTGLVTGFTGPQAQIGETVKRSAELYGEVSRTGMASLEVDITSGPSGFFIDWSIRNTGQTELRGFEDWDVIVAYQDSSGSGLVTRRLTYSSSDPPAVNDWTVQGVYLDAEALTDEVFDPGIVNPGEELIISAQLSPVIASGTTNQVTLAVSNGVTVSAQFSN